jgi:hypothetical protein
MTTHDRDWMKDDGPSFETLSPAVGRCRDCRHWVVIEPDGPNLCAAAEYEWDQTLHRCVAVMARHTPEGTRIFEGTATSPEPREAKAFLWTAADFGCVSFERKPCEEEDAE